jgi:pilus assembly protein Flp/PilA
MFTTFKRFVREEEGAALTEYGLLVGLIALACVAAIADIGQALNAMFTAIAAFLNGVEIPAPPGP